MRIEDYFKIKGTYELVDGLYNVKGSVLIKLNVEKLLVKFGKVSGIFSCYNSSLTSLEGCPKSIGGSFKCYKNKLTSLEGCPKSIGGSFWCFNNNLTSLKGAPTQIGGSFKCYKNLRKTKEYRQYLIFKKLRSW